MRLRHTIAQAMSILPRNLEIVEADGTSARSSASKLHCRISAALRGNNTRATLINTSFNAAALDKASQRIKQRIKQDTS